MFRDKSIEELLNLEEEFLLAKDEERDGSLHRLANLYEELFRRISRDRNSEYATSLPMIKKQLISYLVEYGTYMKTVHRKDDHAAEGSLKRAITIEKNLPIAHYRLGFLHYKKKSYSKALTHFQNAILHQNRGEETKYRLNDQQLYNSHLFLANCGLIIAKDANESLTKLNLDASMDKTPDYERSPLYEKLIHDNEQYLEDHSYQIITEKGRLNCSREACDEALDTKDTIILDFTGRENVLLCNNNEAKLTKNYAELLRYFLIHSNQLEPVTKFHVLDIFEEPKNGEEVPTNTYTQKVTRVRSALSRVGIKGSSVILNKPGLEETSYYYNHSYPFIIMSRTDEIFILSE